jgi:hypothetical protein
MTTLLKLITVLDGALFLFGAIQHAGIAVGPFREPRIIPAALVEAVCGVALAWAAAALLRQSVTARRMTAIANVIALVGVAIGLVALAIGAGPRTPTNDLYHRIMLVLIGASFLLLYVTRRHIAVER